jgi:hypothetical protein
MKKRGATHVGLILSFVIFLVFLSFILITFRSSFTPQVIRETSFEYFRSSLSQMFEGNVNTLVINVSIQSGRDCISLMDIVDDIEEEGMDPMHLIIKNELDEILNYTVVSQSKALQINTGSSYEGFLKIYYSEDLGTSYCTANPSQCGILGCFPQGNDYSVESIRSSDENLEPKIEEIVEWYNTDYEGLKHYLKIPEDMEFEFGFIFENGEEVIIEATQEVPEDSNVYVQEMPIVYYDELGNLKPGFLTIKLWRL